MKIASRVTPEGLAGDGLSTTALIRRVVPAPPCIMAKLLFCGISRRSDIATEQERSHVVAMRPRPSHAISRGVVRREGVGTAFPHLFQVLF